MGTSRTYVEAATVIGCLRPGFVDVVVRPGRKDSVDAAGNPTAATESYPVELFAPELRRANADIWIVTAFDVEKGGDLQTRILPRTRDERPPEIPH